MTSRIMAFDAPSRFVDEQARGPFARFRHEHLFPPQSNGSTMMIDQVAFDAPFGPIARRAGLEFSNWPAQKPL
jgi:ligand-binding SRPBCC domain-containing protein